mmetsp:Transcript_10730/g.17150  ORF Transcript_10730/g.17150 Transcript_10730/m.17150 type:complete len:93 (+) Transcript_10730:471-749(+)
MRPYAVKLSELRQSQICDFLICEGREGPYSCTLVILQPVPFFKFAESYSCCVTGLCTLPILYDFAASASSATTDGPNVVCKCHPSATKMALE